MPTLDLNRAAQILCDAAYLGDAKAAEKWKITTRTIESYRSRLRTDPELSALFGTLRVKLEQGWKDELSSAITTGVKKMAAMIEAAPSGDTFDAKALEAVTNAVKVLSEIQITTEILNAGNTPRPVN
jgi:hypothetical protein